MTTASSPDSFVEEAAAGIRGASKTSDDSDMLL